MTTSIPRPAEVRVVDVGLAGYSHRLRAPISLKDGAVLVADERHHPQRPCEDGHAIKAKHCIIRPLLMSLKNSTDRLLARRRREKSGYDRFAWPGPHPGGRGSTHGAPYAFHDPLAMGYPLKKAIAHHATRCAILAWIQFTAGNAPTRHPSPGIPGAALLRSPEAVSPSPQTQRSNSISQHVDSGRSRGLSISNAKAASSMRSNSISSPMLASSPA